MTDLITPGNELRAQADKLRTLCNAATPGPWTITKVPPYTDPLLMSRYEETPDNGDVLIAGSVDVDPSDQAVMQALHPGIGLALADLLEAVSNDPDDSALDDPGSDRHDACDRAVCAPAAALAVARALAAAGSV